ncbi:MAG: arginase family protein [Planctomycetota bacterium]
MLIPHTRSVMWPESPATRFASLIETDDPSTCRVGLLGLPDDLGVRLNGGNAGASEGPAAFRRALAGYGVADPEGFSWPRVFDAGDIQPSDDLTETHDRVSSAAAALLDAGLLPVGIGGGHDLTYAFVRPVAERHTGICGIYLDAHLDVREAPGSGMPFRALVERCGVKRLDVIGLDPFVNSHEHVRWFTAHGGRIDAIEPEDEWTGEDVFVSIDLDAIDSASAPGVSARNPCGMTAGRARRWAHAAGRSERVRSFDLMELCPPRDDDHRTARVAAMLLLAFLEGLAHRGGTRGG